MSAGRPGHVGDFGQVRWPAATFEPIQASELPKVLRPWGNGHTQPDGTRVEYAYEFGGDYYRRETSPSGQVAYSRSRRAR